MAGPVGLVGWLNRSMYAGYISRPHKGEAPKVVTRAGPDQCRHLYQPVLAVTSPVSPDSGEVPAQHPSAKYWGVIIVRYQGPLLRTDISSTSIEIRVWISNIILIKGWIWSLMHFPKSSGFAIPSLKQGYGWLITSRSIYPRPVLNVILVNPCKQRDTRDYRNGKTFDKLDDNSAEFAIKCETDNKR